MPFRDEITYSYLSRTTRTHDMTRKRRTILGVRAPQLMRKGEKKNKEREKKKGGKKGSARMHGHGEMIGLLYCTLIE